MVSQNQKNREWLITSWPIVHLRLQRQCDGCHGRQELCRYRHWHPSLHSANDNWYQLPESFQGQWQLPHGHLRTRYWCSDFVRIHRSNFSMIATLWWSSSLICTSWRKAVRWRLMFSPNSLLQPSTREGTKNDIFWLTYYLDSDPTLSPQSSQASTR